MTDSINWCNLKKNAKHIGEVSTSRTDGSPNGTEILTSTDEVTGQVRDTLAGKFKKMDDAFNSITSSQFIVTNFGNWSTVAGQQIEEADRLKGYMHPDDSGDVYAIKGSVSLPITRPSTPIGDDRFYLASAVNVEKMRSEQFSAAGYSYQGQWLPNISIPAKSSRADGYALWEQLSGKIIVPLKDEAFITGSTFQDDLNNKYWIVEQLLDTSDLKELPIVSFKVFGGKCNGIDPDDEALDLAIESLKPHQVLSFSGMGVGNGEGLVLTTNHIYKKSNVVIDFANCDVYWKAIEGHVPDRSGNFVSNPRSPGCICFRGELTGEDYTHTLTQDLPEFSDIFPTSGNAANFKRGDWWVVTTDAAPGAPSGKEINYLIESQGGYGNPNDVRMNYITGWDIGSGRVITYKKANPVKNIQLLNVGKFHWQQTITDGSGSGDAFVSQQSCSLFSFEVARDYKITGVTGLDMPYCVIFEQWVSGGVVKKCDTDNPTLNRSDQIVSRNGALYCHAQVLQNKSGRHAIDHTSAAYCTVTNAGETGSKQGAFTTHGSFEHDLVFKNTTGVFSTANSGAEFGESSKRITLKNHIGTHLIASAKVSDLTVVDSSFDEFAKVNADGLTFRNVDIPNINQTAGTGGLQFFQNSSRSGKDTVINGGKINFSLGSPAIPQDCTANIKFSESTILDLRARQFLGSGHLTFSACNGNGGTRGQNILQQERLTILGGQFVSVPWKTGGSKNQTIFIGAGHKAIGLGDASTNKVWVFDKDSGGEIEINIGDASFETTDDTVTHLELSAATGVLKYKSVGATYTGGKIRFQSLVDNGSYIYHKANVENGVTRESVPTESSKASTADNMIIT